VLCRETAPHLVRVLALERAGQAKTPQDRPDAIPLAARPAPDSAELHHQLKSRLLSNVAHELRTPLVAVRGFTKMMLDGRAGAMNRTQSEYLTIISENADRLVALTHDLSRLAKTPPLELAAFDLTSLWRECLHITREFVTGRSVRLESKAPQECLQLTGDRRLVAQAIAGLFQAAVEAAEDGSSLLFELAYARPDEAVISVAIPAAGCERALAAISSARDMASLHGGTLSTLNAAGGGCTVFLTLPIIKPGSGV
jgi:signal transduction histidine kinase